jgi:hypothetical protein
LVLLLFCVLIREICCTADNVQAVGRQLGLISSWQFHAHCCNFTLIETLFCNLGQLLHICMPADNGCQQPTHLPLSMTAHHWQMQSSLYRGTYAIFCYLLLWIFIYPHPITNTIFVWLGFCVNMLQWWVSNIYEWPLFIGFHVKDPLFLSEFNAAWIFCTNF